MSRTERPRSLNRDRPRDDAIFQPHVPVVASLVQLPQMYPEQ
jgi:hypothetical protein